MGLCGFFFRFFALPSCNLNFASKKRRKKRENQWFWLPKPLPKRRQNPFKIDVPKNMGFFTDFCSIFAACCKSQHRFRIGFCSTKWVSDVFLQVAFCMDLGSKKPTKNPWKTMSEPLQNRSQKRVVFQHRFFRVLASISEGLGPPRWSQVGSYSLKKITSPGPVYDLKLDVVWK